MPRLNDVNCTDLTDAIRLGCRTMQSVFNADDDDIPFFSSIVLPRAELAFNDCHSESHIPGRHLNALLTAESVVGVAVEEDAVAKHRRAALFSYGGALPLPLNRQGIGGPLVNFCPHNLREGFHALYALARFRGDDEACVLAERSVAAILDLWSAKHGWRAEQIEAAGLRLQACQGFLHGEGRMLGPLVKLYRATGSDRTLELLLVYVDKACREFFFADGSFDAQRFQTRHIHSITSVLSSLAQAAELLQDASLMARVHVFYQNGLWSMRDALGWTPEAVGQVDSDHGESNITGDILETALILGRHGYTGAYEDAERILRGHLLPSQLRDTSFIVEPDNPNGIDGLRDMAARHRGAFGFPAPYGHVSVGKGRKAVSFNMDIVGGTVASLCEAHAAVVTEEPAGRRLNLLFDAETDAVRVRSPYTHDALHIDVKEPGPLHVRIPSWLNREDISLSGAPREPRWRDDTVLLPDCKPGDGIVLRFPLKEETITLSGDLHIQPIRVRMRGDAVVAMDNFGANLTYFPGT